MDPTSSDRIAQSTARSANDTLERDAEARVEAAAVDTSRIGRRLGELEREWDVERALFALSGLSALVGLALGRWVDRRWFGYAALVAAFQLQHGVQGWCPPLALLRRLRVRTRREIERERTALKALRGDFRDTALTAGSSPVQRALRALEVAGAPA